MSNGRTYVSEPDPPEISEEDKHSLEVSVEQLSARITAFEQNLEAAILSENEFRSNVQTLTGSLDAFVLRHSEEDRHLTKLIEEDTQRSREAKEEYDELASRFDDSVRPTNPTRTREWLSTFYVYVGIVLSVVLMAPLHAVWWVITKVITRVGLWKSSDAKAVYSSSQPREGATSRTTPGSNRGPAGLHHRRRAPVADSTSLQGVTSSPKQLENSPEPDKLSLQETIRRAPKHPATGIPTVELDASKVDVSGKPAEAEEQAHTEDAKGNEGIVTMSSERSHDEDKRSHGSSYSQDDVFLDAHNGLESDAQANIGEHERAEEDGEGTNAQLKVPRRPGWAEPADSNESLQDFATFPSSEFWEISDDDLKLDFQKQDGESSKNGSNS